MPGVLPMLRMHLIRDRWFLPGWLAGISLLGLLAAAAVGGQFPGTAERAGIVSVASASPAFRFLRGLPDGTGVGSVVFFQGYAFTAVLAGLMGILLVTRHTRAEEESGRSEILESTPVPRTAALAATLLLSMLACLVLSGSAGVGFAAAGLPLAGSMLAGGAIGVVGLFFAAAAAVIAQLMPTGRGTNGGSAAVVGLAYLIRGIGDALGEPDAGLLRVDAAWPSWFSPIGWGQRVRPFTEADARPLIILGLAAGILCLIALLIRTRRDLGASLIGERTGRERAGRTGQSLVGLAWRLQRGTLVGWCLAGAVIGGLAGGLAPVVTNVIAGNPTMQDLFDRLAPGSASGAGIVDLFLTALLGIASLLAAAAGVQAVLRLRAEEVEGRAELLLSAPAAAGRWVAANLVVAGISVIVLVVVAGCSATAGLALSGSLGTRGASVVGASLAYAPAAIIFPAVAALVYAVFPRVSIGAGWGFLAAALVLGQFGSLLGLPVWVQDLSPFRHSSAMPVEEFEPISAVLLVAAAATAAGAAAVLIGRRDVTA